MGDGWRQAVLDDVVNISRELVDPRQLRPETRLRHYSIPALDETGSPAVQEARDIASVKFRVARPSVLVSLLNPRIPRVYLAPGSPDSVCSTEFAVLQPKANAALLPDYLYLIASTAEFRRDLVTRVAGTTGSRQRVRPDNLRLMQLGLPPVTTQRRIVDLIGAVDEAARSAGATRYALRLSRRALLADLLPGGLAPPSWDSTTLGEVAQIRIGKTPPRDEPRYWTTDLTRPFCTIADMNGPSVTPRREGVTEAAEVEGKAKRVPAGALLMSFKLTIGRVGVAGVDVFPNEAIAWIEPDQQTLDREYLALWLAAADLESSTGRAVKGATLNSKSLRAIPVVIPPLAEQQRIVSIVRAVDDAEGAAAGTCEALAAVRLAMLPDLLAGRHAIPASYDRLLDPAV